MQKSRNTERKK